MKKKKLIKITLQKMFRHFKWMLKIKTIIVNVKSISAIALQSKIASRQPRNIEIHLLSATQTHTHNE